MCASNLTCAGTEPLYMHRHRAALHAQASSRSTRTRTHGRRSPPRALIRQRCGVGGRGRPGDLLARAGVEHLPVDVWAACARERCIEYVRGERVSDVQYIIRDARWGDRRVGWREEDVLHDHDENLSLDQVPPGRKRDRERGGERRRWFCSVATSITSKASPVRAKSSFSGTESQSNLLESGDQ